MVEDKILKDDFLNFFKDYFNERDEATDCEEPRSKTVNLFRYISADHDHHTVS